MNHVKDPEGIVLLLDRPVPVSAAQLAEAIQRETGRNVATAKKGDGVPEGDFLLTTDSPAHYALRIAGVSYAFHSLAHPYMDNPEKASKDFPELRLRKVIAEHKAWIAMDILDTEKANEQTYQIAGRVLSHFVGTGFLAFYLPPENIFVPCNSADALKHLRANDPLEAIAAAGEPPMIHIDDDNPDLKASVAQARQRFPEFVEALQKHSGDGFSVKTLIRSNGNAEHIWVRVDAVNSGRVKGKIANEPVNLKDHPLGSTVEFAEDAVEDWLFVRNGEPVGFFSKAVIEKLARTAAHQN